MPDLLVPSLSDPDVKIRVLYEWRGDLVPAYKEEGTPFLAYTSYLDVNGTPVYVQTPIGESRDEAIAAHRSSEDDLVTHFGADPAAWRRMMDDA